MTHALVLQHVAVEGPGRIAAALAAAGIEPRAVRIDQGAAVPRTVGDARGLVVMGGPMGVYEADRHPHLANELALIRDALARDVPVLGICLGSQLVAAALGAEVRPSGTQEIGFLPVTLADGASDDPLFAGVAPAFTALHWHGDVFDLPPGAAHLASSAMTAHQAFRRGRAWGLLFHLEADAAQVRAMAETFAADLARANVDAAKLVAAADALTSRLGPVADTVFSRWVALL
jgi:GMP synthase (glutamine-hydrolysing)